MAHAGTSSWLITGASRGIGLEITRQLLASPNNIVLATCRNPEKATKLQALKSDAKGTLHVLPLEITDLASIEAIVKPATELLGDQGLDYLVNNAGIVAAMDLGFAFSPEDLTKTFQTNVVGPGYLSQKLLPLLEKGRKKFVVNMSTSLASIGIDLGPKAATYCISKTALNMLTYKQKVHRPDLTVICMNPGWVKTDLGGDGAVLEPEDSVKGLLNVIANTKHEDSGSFLSYDGSKLPW